LMIGPSATWPPAGSPTGNRSARTTSARTYLVGARADGPWYVVHNDKPVSVEEKT